MLAGALMDDKDDNGTDSSLFARRSALAVALTLLLPLLQLPLLQLLLYFPHDIVVVF